MAEMLVQLASDKVPEGTSRQSPVSPQTPVRPSATRAAPPVARPPSGEQERTLMVVGLPGTAERHTARVTELLQSWSQEGRRWVGDPQAWRIVALPIHSAHLSLLADQQSRWALWIDDDLEAFRRGYRMLKQIAERDGPRRLIAVHSPGLGPKGLLSNLQYVAETHFGIELLVLAR
ncbi:hypothetical protein H1D44_08240 [Halomonas kenyensis]|uniref:Uncharacterized protein n=2 Tax=Billgrantia kenyensis TaxID=321266 RepID=A0A7W0AE28_9GAMM|nr:hypothetical protein [Halomonas kenyensis]MCG6662813.1 hypothetical protein [Halomonas kenyensis]